jgi:hypothetical protein
MIGDMDGALNLKEDTANKSDDFSMGLTPTQAERDLYPTVARMKELLVANYYDSDQIDAMIGDIGTALDTLNDNLAEV